MLDRLNVVGKHILNHDIDELVHLIVEHRDDRHIPQEARAERSVLNVIKLESKSMERTRYNHF